MQDEALADYNELHTRSRRPRARNARSRRCAVELRPRAHGANGHVELRRKLVAEMLDHAKYVRETKLKNEQAGRCHGLGVTPAWAKCSQIEGHTGTARANHAHRTHWRSEERIGPGRAESHPSTQQPIGSEARKIFARGIFT